MDYIGPDEIVSISCSEECCDGRSYFPYSFVLDMYLDEDCVKLEFCKHKNYIDKPGIEKAMAQMRVYMEEWRQDPELMKIYRDLTKIDPLT